VVGSFWVKEKEGLYREGSGFKKPEKPQYVNGVLYSTYAFGEKSLPTPAAG